MAATQPGSYERNQAYKATQPAGAGPSRLAAAQTAAEQARAAVDAANAVRYGSKVVAQEAPQGRQQFTGPQMTLGPNQGIANSDLASVYGGQAPLNAAAQAHVNGLAPPMSPQAQAALDAAMARRGAGASGGAMVQAPFAGRQQGAAMGPAQRMQLPPMGQPRPMPDPFAAMPPRAQGVPQRMAPAMTQRGGMGGAPPMASQGPGVPPPVNNYTGGALGGMGGAPSPEQQAQIRARMAAMTAARGG